VVADLHPECADPGQLLQDTIERAGDEEALRRIWRAAARLRVLDPACRSGDWLVGAAEALAQVYLACLERMDAWVLDEARHGGHTRRTRLRDFRTVLAAADDTHRWPSRRRYARELALARNLRGVDADPVAGAACAA
jgi:glutathione S-transferase